VNPRQSFATRQQRLVLSQANDTDAYGFFNLLTGPELLEDVEELLPEHRERLFPPTETLSMFLAQALSADGSCKQVVNDAAVKRLVAGMPVCSSRTAAYCKARARLPRPWSRRWRCVPGKSSPKEPPIGGFGAIDACVWRTVQR